MKSRRGLVNGKGCFSLCGIINGQVQYTYIDYYYKTQYTNYKDYNIRMVLINYLSYESEVRDDV